MSLLGNAAPGVPIPSTTMASPPSLFSASSSIPSSSTGADCQSGCCSDSRGAITQLLNKSRTGLTRGDLTGDRCLTLLLDETIISGAIYSETDYSVTNTFKSIEAVMSIPTSLSQELKDGVDFTQELTGILYGAEATSGGSGNILYPIRDLARSVEEIPLTKSSKDEAVTLLCEESLALILRYHAKKAISISASSAPVPTPAPPRKKSKKHEPLTLVIPGYFGMKQRKSLVSACKLAGLEVRHIFSRGLATVAGNLSVPRSPLSAFLHSWLANPSNSEADPLVLTVHVNGQGLDVAVVRCERPELENETNVMRFDRLVCLSSGGAPSEGYALGTSVGADKEEKERAICDLIVSQLALAGVTTITAILYSGTGSTKDLVAALRSQASRSNGSPNSILQTVAQVSALFKNAEADTARGGSILSAAELESSKLYIELDDESSSIAYALSIGEDVVNYDVAYRLATSPSSPGEPVVVLKKGSAIHKRYQGPVVTHRPNETEILVSPLEIEGGSVSAVGSFTPRYPPGYPKLTLLQRLPSPENPSQDSWIPLTEPLEILRVGSKDTAKEDKGQLNVALSCKVSFSVAEGTGILRAENFQQESAQEKAQVRSQITRVVLSLLLLLALVAALYGYTEYQKYATHQQNVQWLTEFYAENAPQRLEEDEQFIEKTLRKYEGKLFLLWRQLEKTYKVKWVPPGTISETD